VDTERKKEMKTSTILLIAGAGVAVWWFMRKEPPAPGESVSGGAATRTAQRLGAVLKEKLKGAPVSGAASNLKSAKDISGEPTPPGANASNPPCDFSEPVH
jgi:hypothetical protein